jgi:ankyrin repeat protein
MTNINKPIDCYLDAIRFIKESGVDINIENDNYPLRWAAENGCLETVKYLVRNGANVHTSNEEALRRAAVNGHLDIIKILVKNGANVNACDNEVFYWTTKNNHTKVTEYLKNKQTTNRRN